MDQAVPYPLTAALTAARYQDHNAAANLQPGGDELDTRGLRAYGLRRIGPKPEISDTHYMDTVPGVTVLFIIRTHGHECAWSPKDQSILLPSRRNFHRA